jgi:hypothetical protein
LLQELAARFIASGAESETTPALGGQRQALDLFAVAENGEDSSVAGEPNHSSAGSRRDRKRTIHFAQSDSIF